MRVRSDAGFTLIELLIVCAIIGIISALAAPFLMAAKESSREASAIGSLRAINSAQGIFATSCGGGYYTATIATLIDDGYVSPDVILNPKSSYWLSMTAGAQATQGPPDCHGDPTYTSYYLSATPYSATSGRRGFATSPDGTIWQDMSGAAPTEPFVAGPTTSPIQ
jgi:prepilin-type N-terminal cleavage/methylation domain-containing protein